MSRSRWGIGLAFAGLIALLIWANGFYSGALSGTAPPQKQSIASQPADQARPPTALTGDYAAYPDKYADECYKAENHDSADLCAQWRAAIAAEKAADAAQWGIRVDGIAAALSFISIVLVFFALRQTERSLREAREANVLAREAHQRELRAYLNAHDIAVADFLPGKRPCFQFKPINSGQTPAYDVQCCMGLAWGIDVEPHAMKVVLRDADRPRFSRAVIPPGLEPSFDFPKAYVLGQKDWDATVSGELVFVFAGVLTYRDIFKARHKTTFKYFLRPEVLNDKGDAVLSACSKGNRAT